MNEKLYLLEGRFGSITITIEGDCGSGKTVLMDKILSLLNSDPWYKGITYRRTLNYTGNEFPFRKMQKKDEGVLHG